MIPFFALISQNKVQAYSVVAQKINADFLCDEENPLVENREEQELSSDIERDLNEFASCIGRMRDCHETHSSTTSSSPHIQEQLIKRYNEIHYDLSTEFKNTLTTVTRKRESMELFHSSKGSSSSEDQDSSVAKLLRERSGIASSMKSINDVISQAFDTKNALGSQRAMLSGAGGGLSTMGANMPTYNRLIDGIQKKKYREALIVAVVIGILVCFTIWWIFIR